MLLYLLKRLLLMVPTVVGITIVVFVIARAAPGDPVSSQLGGGGGAMGASSGSSSTRQEQSQLIERRRKKLGLDKPKHIQYFRWVNALRQGDLGVSQKYKVPVAEKLWPAMLISLQLNLVSLLLIYIISVPLGIHAAVRRGHPEEKAIGVTLFGLYSAPSFWVATLLLFYFCNPTHFEIWSGLGLHQENHERLTYLGQVKDWWWNAILPVICLTYGGLATLSRFARTGMLEVIRQDYIRTARAKGLPERTVIMKHALRNSMIPIVTLMASLLPAMIGGSVIVEYIFNINGMGRLGFEAILSRDYDMIMAITTLSAILVMFGMLLSDLMYTLIDPRISLEG
jgi:peptide/nickel transport system permease protein